MTLPYVIALTLAVVSIVVLWQRQRQLRREAYIRSYAFPRGLYDKVIAQHPQLTHKDMALVAQGLRQFFLAYLKSGHQFVSMPSQIADDLWHEFILYTRHYQDFCQHAFGRFLHHTPAVVLRSASQSNAGLRRCWYYACKEENIAPRSPLRLPLLFALDSKFNIPYGFHYVPDCSALRCQTVQDGSSTAVYCGGSFSDSGIDGGTSGLGDDSGSDGSGDGGGCGGGGD